jgi:hypothetical protein
VTWELCYGGVPVATGSLGSDQEVSFTDIDAIEPSMDSSGFTFTAWHEDGRLSAIEAVCIRPGMPPTRAEATARAKWSGARNQQEAPSFRRFFLAGTEDAVLPAFPDPHAGERQRSVCVYQHFSRLLTHRRRQLRGMAPAPAAVPQISPDRTG